MESDSVDRIVQAWARYDPRIRSSSLEVTGRLVLCAAYCDRAVAAALRPFSLSIADFDVLNTLRRRSDRHGTNPSDLARSSLITTGAMTARLNRLERAGLIRRVPDPADRRAVLIRLTRQGVSKARQALGAVIAASETFLEPLTTQQQHTAAGVLRQLLLHHETPP
ncbi:MAG: MarR family transcriptional regulator [Nocardiopsaceae bacterium]|jgi:DNA-binding MarR family transcriptional regulator|nr:MarR family transcriptional regulator [Nocardiopsaceae bacterium]